MALPFDRVARFEVDVHVNTLPHSKNGLGVLNYVGRMVVMACFGDNVHHLKQSMLFVLITWE